MRVWDHVHIHLSSSFPLLLYVGGDLEECFQEVLAGTVVPARQVEPLDASALGSES